MQSGQDDVSARGREKDPQAKAGPGGGDGSAEAPAPAPAFDCEIERLRLRVAGLERERDTLLAEAREIEAIVRRNDMLRAQWVGLEAELDRLRAHTILVRRERERQRGETAVLQTQLEAIRTLTEEQVRRFAVREQECERSGVESAGDAVDGATDRKELLAALQEIPATLMRSVELALEITRRW